MVIEQGYTTRDGIRMGFYQWDKGKKYTYEPGDDKSRQAAYEKALKQQRAAYLNTYGPPQ